MTKKTLATTNQRAVKGRIRPALANAVRLIIEEGLTQADAAQRVGMRQESLSVALRKPHVAALKNDVKRAFLASATSKAWVIMAQLANGAVSEDVRFKAAKVFLEAAGELSADGARDQAPRSLVQIVVNHPQVPGGGADERHPGVIERGPGVIEIIRHPIDLASPYQIAES